MQKFTKVIAVINNFEMADAVLSKAVRLAHRESANLEIIFVHEEELFGLPDFFRFKEISPDQPIDKEKVQKEITAKLDALGVKERCAILVFVDDTADHVLVQTENEKETLIVLSYHEDTVKKVIKKSHLPVLVVKQNSSADYQKIIVPVDFSPVSTESIELAKALFPEKTTELVYDYRYIIGNDLFDQEGIGISSMDIDLNDQEKNAAKKELKSLSEKMGVKSSFIVQESTLEDDLVTFIQANNFNLAVLGSNDADSLFFGSVSFDVMEASPIDLMIYAP